MSKVTIVVPARNELYLARTVDEIFDKAAGDIQVLVGLDACWDMPLPKDRPGLTIIHWGRRRGHRALINAGAEIGRGDYIMKVDAHCAFDEGFDVKLAENCDSDWLVIPRRYSLDPDTWKPVKKPVDYEYVRFPYDENGNFIGVTAKYWWDDRQRSRANIPIDENMICQGSCMFMPMPYFKKLIYPMDESSYGYWLGEQFEIGMKVWLSGGKTMTNKNTWYAHLWKGNRYKEAFLKARGTALPPRESKDAILRGMRYQTDYWLGNQWQDRIHDFDWLLERFWPVPTWDENWRDVLETSFGPQMAQESRSLWKP